MIWNGKADQTRAVVCGSRDGQRVVLSPEPCSVATKGIVNIEPSIVTNADGAIEVDVENR